MTRASAPTTSPKHVPVLGDGALAIFHDAHVAPRLLDALGELGNGILMTDGERVLWANEAYASMLGFTRDEVLSPAFRVLDRVAPEARALTIARTEARAAGELPPEPYVMSLLRKDGSRVECEVSVRAWGPGRNALRLCVVRDVSRARRDAAELEAARRQLALTEKLAALGSLVSGLAHEVRTPLTIIETNAHLLERISARARASGNAEELLRLAPGIVNDITSSIERANALVKSLRRFTRQQGAAHLGPVDVEPAVREAVELHRAASRGRAEIEFDLAPTPIVNADRAELQQVVLNLLENAVEASVDATLPVKVTTGSQRHGALICVEDHGAGMSEDVRARCFEPLFTTKPHGTGLGLSIVKRIVDDHGGRIECAPTRGGGTTFTVWLPASGDRSSRSPTDASTPR